MKFISLSASKKRIQACKIAVPILAVLCSIFGAMAFYTADGRYFSDTIYAIAFYTSLAIGVVVTLAAPLAVGNGITVTATQHPTSNIIAKAPAVALLGVIIGVVAKMNARCNTTVDIVILVLALASAIHYTLVGIEGYKAVVLYTGYGHCLLCLAVILSLYRDLTIELNAPFKLILQFAFTFGLFNTLANLRRTHTSCSARQFLFAKIGYVILALPCGAYAVGSLMAEQYEYGIDYVTLPLFLFASGLYTLAQLVSVRIIAPEDEESEELQEAEYTTAPSVDGSTDTDEE